MLLFEMSLYDFVHLFLDCFFNFEIQINRNFVEANLRAKAVISMEIFLLQYKSVVDLTFQSFPLMPKMKSSAVHRCSQNVYPLSLLVYFF